MWMMLFGYVRQVTKWKIQLHGNNKENWTISIKNGSDYELKLFDYRTPRFYWGIVAYLNF